MRTGLLAVLVAAGLLTGCAGGGSPGAPGGESASGGNVSSSSSPSPSSSSSSGAGSAEMTLTGVVEAGVEAGCLILKAEGKAYLLVGGPTEVVKAGAHVVVRGRPDPGMISYCQQGEPFRVSEAHPA